MARKPGFHAGLVLAVILLIATACSGGGDPISGSLPGEDQGLSSRVLTATPNRVLWGYWSCVLNADTGTVEVIPARGTMMHVNAIEWMQPPGGSIANLGVVIADDSGWPAEGRFDIDVTLRHPFAGLDQFTGFDVMGVFITDGHDTVQSQSGVTLTDRGDDDAWMLNADGYTRWWNQDEFFGQTPRIFSYIPGKLGFNPANLDARLNPYKYFANGLGLDDDEGIFTAENLGERGHFPAGAAITRRYELEWPVVGGIPQFGFDYAVVASWDAPNTTPPTSIPDDFPLTANALEPVALSVTDNSDLYYDTINDVQGGAVYLDLEVFDWQALDPAVSVPAIIDKVIVEFQDSEVFPAGSYHEFTSGTWTVTDGSACSSIWDIEISSLSPEAIGETPVLIIFETIYDYDNGFGTDYPVGEPLSSYFTYDLEVYGAPGTPTCEEPIPEFATRTWIDIEEFTSVLDAPGGTVYNVDWSVHPYGDSPTWQNTDTDAITVNWYAVTEADPGPPVLGTYEVCVSVYSPDGFSSCCTSVTVDDVMSLTPVTGQDGVTPPQQPDQGAQPCDITVWNSTGSSTPQILYQDTALSEARIYRFNDTYSSVLGTSTLNNTGYPAPLDDATTWNDFHKFDVTPNSQAILITSANDTTPSIADVNTYNINDPYHSFVLPYWNMTGAMKGIGIFGDAGWDSGGPPMPPDPDAVSWKQFVDWTSGAAYYDARMYGLMTISDRWLPLHPAETHPGTIWAMYSNVPYADIGTDYDGFGMSGMSTQYSVPGEIDDTDPVEMAVGVDDSVPVVADFDGTSGEFLSNIVCWYILSSEANAANRKVHIMMLPEAYNDPAVDTFFYSDYIGTGSAWGLDFGGTWAPVDLEVFYANEEGAELDMNYNWLCVLLDTGTGFAVNVYRFDPFFGTLALIDTYEDTSGVTPTALDCDTNDKEIHVLYDDAGTYEVTVLEFT